MESLKGTKCVYPCAPYDSFLYGDHFRCYTSPDNSTWEFCGNWNVPENKTNIMEFTQHNYVCADYCQPYDSYEYCNYVYWDYNSTTNTAKLKKGWDYCHGYAPPPMPGWQVALIVLGVVLFVVVFNVSVIFFYPNQRRHDFGRKDSGKGKGNDKGKNKGKGNGKGAGPVRSRSRSPGRS